MSDRFICTADNPWKAGMGPAYHPDAKEVGEQQDGWPGGDYQRYECLHCGHSWKEELPQ